MSRVLENRGIDGNGLRAGRQQVCGLPRRLSPPVRVARRECFGWTPFEGLWIPLLLSVLLVLLLDYGRRQEMTLDEERFQGRWLQAARNRIEKYRSESTFEAQIKRLHYEFRRAVNQGVQQRPARAFIPSGEDLATAFIHVFPPSHRPPGTRIIAFSIDPSGQAAPLDCPPFSPPGGTRILAALQPGSLNPDSLGKAEKESLDRRFASVFGGNSKYLYKSDVFSLKRRGLLIPCFFGGQKNFILWDFLILKDPQTLKDRTVISYFLVFPKTLTHTTRFREFALRQISSPKPAGISGLLFPWAGKRKPQVAFPWQMRVGRRIQKFLEHPPKDFDLRADLVPNRMVPLPKLGLMVFRHLPAPYLPDELWLVSRLPAPSSRLDNPLYFFMLVFLLTTWATILVRLWLFNSPLPLNIGQWFSAFLLLVGIFPLVSLLLTGLYQIETAAFRQTQTAIREATDLLDEVDAESNSLFLRFVQECQSLFADRTWARSMALSQPGPCAKSAQTAFARFSGKGLPLDDVFVIPPAEDPLIFSASGPPTLANNRIAEYFFPFAYAANRYLQPRDLSEPEMKRRQLELVRNFLRIYNAVSGDLVHELFLGVRGVGDLVEVGNEHTFQFSELLASNEHPGAWVFLRGNPRSSYEAYLGEACGHLSLANPGQRFFAGKIVPGGQTPLFPRENEMNFWKSSASSGLLEEMNLVARTQSRLTFRSGDRMRIIQFCDRTVGFIIGTEIDLKPFTQTAAWQRRQLLGVILALVAPILLLGVSMARYLLDPLSQVERGLRLVAGGDLSIRVGLPRQDELGRLTQAFDRMITGLETRRRLGRFVSGSLEAAIARGLTSPTAVPEELEATVLISDMRNFTTLSETHPVAAVVEMLNRHLDVMARLIQARGGHIDKFIGDAIVALFPAKHGTDHAYQAVATAHVMMRAHQDLQAERKSRGEFEYRIGIGIASGSVQIGTLRSSSRLELAVVGPPRSEAEQLEALSKEGRHTRIMVSRRVAESLPRLSFEALGHMDAFELSIQEIPDA